MKYKAGLVVIGCLFAVNSAIAGHGGYPGDNAYTDYAKVTRVEPIYSTVQISDPTTDCWEEKGRYTSHHKSTQVQC